ncbi:MAG: hypothetical protein ONB46_14015 [candidate division KSB1 bacterium]|nr:hypothetical protein [candidate division KSB1 bacterium]MDZ7366946.1 hypothetical protein [candidate division KSB1 bacterium]MDZ7406831.1 hypothetical protein [candidate division KSB1 bacterium]
MKAATNITIFPGAQKFVLQLSLAIYIIEHDKKICDGSDRAQ